MAEHHFVEIERGGSGIGTALVLGLVIALMVALISVFFVFGNPSRFMGSSTPNQTNVNMPSLGQPQNGVNIEVPRQIDININPPAQAPPLAPAQPGNPGQ